MKYRHAASKRRLQTDGSVVRQGSWTVRVWFLNEGSSVDRYFYRKSQRLSRGVWECLEVFLVGTAVEEVVLASSGQKSGVPLATLRSTGRPLKTEEHPPPNVGRAEEGSSSAWRSGAPVNVRSVSGCIPTSRACRMSQRLCCPISFIHAGFYSDRTV